MDIKPPQKEKTLEELLALVTNLEKRTYLDLLSKLHYNSKATQAMSIAESTPYGWMMRDKVFNEAYEATKREDNLRWLDLHLNNIREIAFDKSVPPQSRLLGSIFETKKLDPSYRDNPPEYLTQVGSMVVHLNVPDRDYLPAPTITVKQITEGGTDAIQGQGKS